MRFFQRLVIFGLIGLVSPFGVIALLNAQAKLDRQFELSMQGAGAPLQTLRSSTSASAEASWPHDPAPPQPAELARVNRLPTPLQPTAIEIIPAEGKKAVVVRVSNGLNAIDFAQPDRWVDVILTRQVETSAIFNDVVVQNARILAVDSDTDGQDRSMARSVTLEVDLVGAQKLLLASQVGFLSLILRRPGDDPAQDTRQVAVDDLTTPPATTEPALREAELPAAASTETQVETTASIAVPATTPRQTSAPESPAAAAPPRAEAPPEPAPPAVATATVPPSRPETESAPTPASSPANSNPPVESAAGHATSHPAPEQDDSRFLLVRVKRPGAEPTVHRVPKEQKEQ